MSYLFFLVSVTMSLARAMGVPGTTGLMLTKARLNLLLKNNCDVLGRLSPNWKVVG